MRRRRPLERGDCSGVRRGVAKERYNRGEIYERHARIRGGIPVLGLPSPHPLPHALYAQAAQAPSLRIRSPAQRSGRRLRLPNEGVATALAPQSEAEAPTLRRGEGLLETRLRGLNLGHAVRII